MSRKPENVFIDSVHRHLPSATELHREGMANPYRGGTFDQWYSGSARDLWVEYKFVVLPKRGSTMIDPMKLLSPLQQQWGRSRYVEGRSVWVVIGCKEGGLVMTACRWEKAVSCVDFLAYMNSRKELAERIRKFTMER